ncbi:MAG: TonB-dependent receptor, partial [Muribaculaceae bacterium]|nr:TonB-dependent receptor [Muribaculaceae bacterium]
LAETYDANEIIGYKPEESYNYELGTHLMMFDGRLTVDASVFYIDCRDQQLTRFPDGTTTGRIMDNAGRTRSIGAELSAEYHLSSHWILNASWGHADARFVDYDDGIHDYSGRFVPYAPLNTLHGSLRYDSAIPSWHIDRIQVVAGVRGGGVYTGMSTIQPRSRFMRRYRWRPRLLPGSLRSGAGARISTG